MPEFIWNEYEVIECLGVLPETEEFFTSHYYRLVKDELLLQMTIWQHESCIAISLSRESDESSFFTIYFIVRDFLEFINTKNFSSLKFRDSIIVSSRFWMYEENDRKNYFDKDIFPTKLDIELCVYPKLQIKFH